MSIQKIVINGTGMHYPVEIDADVEHDIALHRTVWWCEEVEEWAMRLDEFRLTGTSSGYCILKSEDEGWLKAVRDYVGPMFDWSREAEALQSDQELRKVMRAIWKTRALPDGGMKESSDG